MNENNRIQLPGRVGVKTQFTPGHNADGVTVQLTGPEGINVLVMGGETKLERHAVALLAGIVANPHTMMSEEGFTDTARVERAVAMAKMIQEKCIPEAAKEATKLDGV